MACAGALSRLCAVAPALPPDTEYPATRPVTAIPSIGTRIDHRWDDHNAFKVAILYSPA